MENETKEYHLQIITGETSKIHGEAKLQIRLRNQEILLDALISDIVDDIIFLRISNWKRRVGSCDAKSWECRYKEKAEVGANLNGRIFLHKFQFKRYWALWDSLDLRDNFFLKRQYSTNKDVSNYLV